MEGSTIDSMCRCCAAEGIFKDIKTSYHWMGEEEVYGDILRECFDIKLATVEEGGICEVCITQLRNAANFKKQVLHTEKKFKRHLETRRFKPTEVKEEDGNSSDDIDRGDDSAEDEDYVPDFEIPIKTETTEESKSRKRAAKATTSRAKKSKIDADDKSVAYRELKIKTEVSESEDTNDVKPKVEEIFCNVPVRAPASQRPKATGTRENLAIRVTPIKINPPKISLPSGSIKIKPADENDSERTENEKQRHNIRTILLNSNATPIRKHYVDTGYYCCFCKEIFPIPADLKTHTINEHDHQTINKFMKRIRLSHFLVKLDITGLRCNICKAFLDNIDELMGHLNSVHMKGLHIDVKSYFACFKFKENEIKCHICSAKFRNFRVLQEHMNKHSKNFICDECGDSYINLGQLKCHLISHASGTFKCKTCEKVYKSNLNLQMHIRQIHSGVPMYKCNLCENRFKTKLTKKNHMTKVHGTVFADLECQACNKTFKSLDALCLHRRRDHLMERRHKCDICERTFFTAPQLKNHEITHTGQRDFKCDVCSKLFTRKYALTEHMRSHTGDRRFKCSYCDMAFLQKCSLKGHLRTRHDAELK